MNVISGICIPGPADTTTVIILECTDAELVGELKETTEILEPGRHLFDIVNDGALMVSCSPGCSASFSDHDMVGRVTAVVDSGTVEVEGVRLPITDVAEFLPPAYFLADNLTNPITFRAHYAA
tara:strand:+ start:176 stop:544 length:369 start_codon:yes stop_codon:yes gene_type:complete